MMRSIVSSSRRLTIAKKLLQIHCCQSIGAEPLPMPMLLPINYCELTAANQLLQRCKTTAKVLSGAKLEHAKKKKNQC